jgi:hypothetical protein
MSISVRSKRMAGLGLAAALFAGGVATAAVANAATAATVTVKGSVVDGYTGKPIAGAQVYIADSSTHANIAGPLTTAADGTWTYTASTAASAVWYQIGATSGSLTSWGENDVANSAPLGGYTPTNEPDAATAWSHGDDYDAYVPSNTADPVSPVSWANTISLFNQAQVATISGTVAASGAGNQPLTSTPSVNLNIDGPSNWALCCGTSWNQRTNADGTWAAQTFVGSVLDSVRVNYGGSVTLADTSTLGYPTAYFGGSGTTASTDSAFENLKPFGTVPASGLNVGTTTINPLGGAIGTVKDSATGAPVMNADVAFINVKTNNWTDDLNTQDGTGSIPGSSPTAYYAPGTFVERWLPAGTYFVQYSAPGYATTYLGGSTIATKSTKITVTSGSLVQVPNQTMVAGTALSGTISGMSPGDEIDLYSGTDDQTWVSWTTVDSSGHFSFPHVAPGTYRIGYSSFGWIGGTKFENASVITVGASPVTFNGTASPSGTVAVNIYGANGAYAAENVVATLIAANGDAIGWTTAWGQTSIWAPAGTYKLQVSSPTGKYVTQTTPSFNIVAHTSISIPDVTLLKQITNVTAPAITGAAKVGHSLSVSAGTWSVPGVAPTYQWQANGKSIPGATKSTFKVTKSQAGKSITVNVTAAPEFYAPSSVVTNATKAVVSPSKTTVTAKALGGGAVEVTASVSPKASGKVVITVGGKKYTVTLSGKSKAAKTVTGLTAGTTVTVGATYKGSKTVLGSKAKGKKVTVS